MTEEQQPIIRAEKLRLNIATSTLLDNASVEVRVGERLAIVGPNGAGKTSLIRCLLGLTRPDKGSITINGLPMSRLGRKELARLMSYVPQQLPERISFTAAEYVGMSRYAYGAGLEQDHRDDTDQVSKAMEMTGVADLRAQPLSTMSGGERQRVSIAAALAQQSPVLILDEPSAHLDPKQRDLIHGMLARITREHNTTLIVITHDLNWASADFERIIGMRGGQTLVSGSAGEFMQKHILQQVFDADWLLHPHPESGRPMLLPHQPPLP